MRIKGNEIEEKFHQKKISKKLQHFSTEMTHNAYSSDKHYVKMLFNEEAYYFPGNAPN